MAQTIKRLSYIELLRFIFAVFIVGHHVDEGVYGGIYLKNGYLCVEFFFFLTGYFTTKHFSEKCLVVTDTEILRYVLKKIFKIFPHALISIALIWGMLFSNDKIQLQSLLYVPFEILFLPMTAFYQPRINGVLWFITVLMIELPLYIYIIRRHCANVYILCLISLTSYMFLYFNYQTVAYWIHWPESIISCFLRGCAGICVGGLVYYVSRYIKNNTIETVTVKSLCSLISLFFMVSSVYLIFCENNMIPYEILVVEMLASSLIFVFADRTYLSSFNSKFLNGLGRMSAIIYCVHPAIINIFTYYLHYNDVGFYSLWIACVILTMILSEMISFVINYIEGVLKWK